MLDTDCPVTWQWIKEGGLGTSGDQFSGSGIVAREGMGDVMEWH